MSLLDETRKCGWLVRVALLVLFVRISPYAAASEIKVSVITNEGEEQPQVLKEITDDGFKFENGAITARDIAELRFNTLAAEPSHAKATVYLRNGDVLLASVVSGDDSKLTLKSDALGEIALDTKFIDALIFKQKETPPADQVASFLRQKLTEDLLLLPKGEQARGAMEKMSDKDLNFNVEKQSKQYTFEQVLGVRLVPLDEYKAPADFRATLQLLDGSSLTGKLQALKENAVQFQGIDGKAWTVPTTALKSFIFKGGNLVYLSELTPKSIEEKPYVSGVPIVFHWRRDQSTTGRPMSIAGKTYEKGVGMHSFARLTYDLGGQYVKFLAQVGLDSAAPPTAVCTWKLSIDGKEAAAGLARANDVPKPVKVELNGAKELELICDYGPDDDDAGDHLDWASARLIKR